MASKTIEARLIIAGEDRASTEIAKVVKAFKEAEKAAGFSDKLEKLGKAYTDVERQVKAAGAVMSARGPLESTVKNLTAVEKETARLAKEYDTARKAVTEFTAAQKVAKTADAVQQAAALSNEVKRLGTAYRTAEKDVKQLNAAFVTQTSTLRSAESAASRLGVDLSSLEKHQAGLARQTDLATRALRAQVAAEEAGARAASARAQRSAARKEAVSTVVAGAGIIAAHKGRQIGIEAVDQAASFDYAKRYQVVAGGVSEQAQRTKLLPQALRIGQETKFTNEDIVEAQTATLQGLPMKGDAKAAVAAAIVENVKNYAVMMRAPMEASAQGIRAFLQTSQKDISTEEKAVFEAKRASNLLVKMAKLGGMKDNDVQDYITYGVPTGTSAGLSDTTLAALGAAGKRSGLGGSETGVFIRAAASKLVAPTRGGHDVLRAAGIEYNNFTKMPGGLSTDNLESFSKNRFGKGFTADQKERLSDLLQDGDVIADRGEFTKQVSAIVQEGFAKNKKGKTSAQDARNIAKMIGDFHKLSVESVDSEGLLDAILSNPKMSQAMLNAFFTDKHGGKAAVLASQYKQFSKDREELKNLQGHDPDFAANAAKYMSEGLGGTIDNLKGSWETLVLNVGEANSGLIKFAAEGLSNGTDMFSNLSRTSQQVLSLVGGGAAVAGGVYGAAKIGGKLLGFGGGAVALNGSAAALSAAAAALTEAAVLQGAKGVAGGGASAAENAVKAAPLAALGLTGITLGLGAGAAFAGYATADQLPKIAQKEGPGAIDPATGEHLDTAVPETTPWVRNWIKGWFSKPEVADEAGKVVGENIGKGIVEAPLPPKRPAMLEDFKTKADETGTEAGKTLLQRITEAVGAGIMLPINFAPGMGMGGGGGGGSGIQKASFSPGGGGFGGGGSFGSGIGAGGGGGGGLIRRGGGGGGGGTGVPGAPNANFTGSNADAVRQAAASLGTSPEDLATVISYETIGKFSPSIVGGKGNRYQGLIQFGPRERAMYGANGGQSFGEQMGAVVRYLKHRGFKPGMGLEQLYATINGGNPNVSQQKSDGNGTIAQHVARMRGAHAARARMFLGSEAKDAAGLDPKLVKGLDGKEGLDLGNGTMKMPDGSIRSIVPAAPASAIGGGGGRGDMRAAAERMHQAADRMEGMGFHGQISLAVTGGGRQQVRATALKVRGRGGMTADLGVSEPGAKEDMADWA